MHQHLRDVELADQFPIQNLDTPLGNRPHGQFLVIRHAQLPDETEIERSLDGLRDFVRNRHASARERQDEDVRPSRVVRQAGGELSSRVHPIEKPHDPL